MKKIQFRYDDSDEANKCIEWINEENNKNLVGLDRYYYTNDGRFSTFHFPHYTLLTPAEFLREVTNQEWQPKVGDEVGIGAHGVFEICTYLGKAPHHYVGYNKSGEVIYGIAVSEIRPIPTLKQKIVEVLKDYEYDCSATPSKGREKFADRIIEMVKGGSHE